MEHTFDRNPMEGAIFKEDCKRPWGWRFAYRGFAREDGLDYKTWHERFWGLDPKKQEYYQQKR